MLSLDQDNVSALEAPLTQAETIKTSKSGKSPGPDGYPTEFYKVISAKLMLLLCERYEEALQRKTLPLTMTTAIISVLLNRNKDPLKCDSSWPISLLCSDYKVLTKPLQQLEPTMHNIIHSDQIGFMTSKQLAGNLHNLFNIIYAPNHNHLQEVLKSSDALDQAVDRASSMIYLKLLESLILDRNFLAG